jgi:hypothetical protein
VTIKSEPVGSRVAQEVVFYTTGVDKKQKLHDLLQKDKEGNISSLLVQNEKQIVSLMTSAISVLLSMHFMVISLRISVRELPTISVRIKSVSSSRQMWLLEVSISLMSLMLSTSMNLRLVRTMSTVLVVQLVLVSRELHIPSSKEESTNIELKRVYID